MSANEETVNASDCDDWCRTVYGNTVKKTFLWTIENFMERPEEIDEYIVSSQFTLTGPEGKITAWSLQLYPKGENPTPEEEPDEDDYVSVYLNNCSDFNIRAKCSFSIIDSSKKKQETFDLEPSKFHHGEHKNTAWGGKVVQLEELKNNSDTLLPEGNITIFCQVEVIGKDELYSGSKFSNKTAIQDECQRQVTDHLDNLLAEKNCSEVSCDEEVFPCHQAILSARSPVFLAMFQTDMAENQSKKVIIGDVKKEVFSEMLRFMYTGKVSSDDSLKKLARDLLAAANMYQLDLLKKLCEAQLCSTLDGSNCLELLVFGDIHEASNLKTAALESVLMNLASLSDTDVYKDFIEKYPGLAFEVTKSMFSKKESSSVKASVNNNN